MIFKKSTVNLQGHRSQPYHFSFQNELDFCRNISWEIHLFYFIINSLFFSKNLFQQQQKNFKSIWNFFLLLKQIFWEKNVAQQKKNTRGHSKFFHEIATTWKILEISWKSRSCPQSLSLLNMITRSVGRWLAGWWVGGLVVAGRWSVGRWWVDLIKPLTAWTQDVMMMIMINWFCGMVDRRKTYSLISKKDHCQRSSPLRISDMPRAGFEPAQNLSSSFLEWSCTVLITTTPWRNIVTCNVNTAPDVAHSVTCNLNVLAMYVQVRSCVQRVVYYFY